MHVTLDQPAAAALMRVSRELVRNTPGNFREVHLTARATAEGVACGVTCPQFPEAGTLAAKEPVRLAVLDLLRELERLGHKLAGVRVVSIVSDDNKVATSIVPLEE